MGIFHFLWLSNIPLWLLSVLAAPPLFSYPLSKPGFYSSLSFRERPGFYSFLFFRERERMMQQMGQNVKHESGKWYADVLLLFLLLLPLFYKFEIILKMKLSNQSKNIIGFLRMMSKVFTYFFRLTSCYFSLWCLSFSHNTCACSVAQFCWTFCDPMDCRTPGSSVQGIFQARILKWVAISYSRGSSWSRDWTSISCLSCTGRWILYHCATWEALNTWFQFISFTLAVL